MKELLQKISDARQIIKDSNLKKSGRNTYSEYDYYTPEQVGELVTNACNEKMLLNTYELIRTEYGLVAQITVWDLETDQNKTFSMATEIPSIKATNVAQQLGGAVTYSERYLLMAIYDIKDNNLDFDNSSATKKSQTTSTQSKFKFIDSKIEASAWVSDTNIKAMIESIANGNKQSVIDALPKYKWSKANKEKITKELDK